MTRHLLHGMAQWNWGGIAFVVLILPLSGLMTHFLRVWAMSAPELRMKEKITKFSLSEYNKQMQPFRDQCAAEKHDAIMRNFRKKLVLSVSPAERAFILAPARRKG